MPFVLDASVAACWAFADENHPVAAVVLERMRTDIAIAPSIWWFEVRNVMIVNERRGRLTEIDSHGFLRALAQLGVRIDPAPDEGMVLALARTQRLSVYDASYLALALREGVALATLDQGLGAAARAVGVGLVEG